MDTITLSDSTGTIITSEPVTWTTTTTNGTGDYWYYPYTTTVPYSPSISPPFSISYTTPEEFLIKPPKCGECGKEVESVQSYVKNNILICIYYCHGDKRRVDAPLSRFNNDENKAREYVSSKFDYMFVGEKYFKKVSRKDKEGENALSKWLKK